MTKEDSVAIRSNSDSKSITPTALSSTSKSNAEDYDATREDIVAIAKDNTLEVEEQEEKIDAAVVPKVSTLSNNVDVKKKDAPLFLLLEVTAIVTMYGQC